MLYCKDRQTKLIEPRIFCRYEAFVIYSFMSLLLEYIGGPGQVEAIARDEIVNGSCMYGTCCFPAMQVWTISTVVASRLQRVSAAYSPLHEYTVSQVFSDHCLATSVSQPTWFELLVDLVTCCVAANENVRTCKAHIIQGLSWHFLCYCHFGCVAFCCFLRCNTCPEPVGVMYS